MRVYANGAPDTQHNDNKMVLTALASKTALIIIVLNAIGP